MLILTRKPGESLYIGDNVKVTVVEIKGNQIRVGIDAPADLRIYREEIYVQILEENRTAAAPVPVEGLESLTRTWERVPSRPAAGGASGRIRPLTGVTPAVVVKRRRPKDPDE